MLHALHRTTGMSVLLSPIKLFLAFLPFLSFCFGCGSSPQSALHIGQETGFFSLFMWVAYINKHLTCILLPQEFSQKQISPDSSCSGVISSWQIGQTVRISGMELERCFRDENSNSLTHLHQQLGLASRGSPAYSHHYSHSQLCLNRHEPPLHLSANTSAFGCS